MRSMPMPVSTCFAGNQTAIGQDAIVLNKDQVPQLHVAWAVTVDADRRGRACFPSHRYRGRGRCEFREHGPQGPVSAISQKLSFSAKDRGLVSVDVRQCRRPVIGLIVSRVDRWPTVCPLAAPTPRSVIARPSEIASFL